MKGLITVWSKSMIVKLPSLVVKPLVAVVTPLISITLKQILGERVQRKINTITEILTEVQKVVIIIIFENVSV
jgi:hypothetical protein